MKLKKKRFEGRFSLYRIGGLRQRVVGVGSGLFAAPYRLALAVWLFGRETPSIALVCLGLPLAPPRSHWANQAAAI